MLSSFGTSEFFLIAGFPPLFIYQTLLTFSDYGSVSWSKKNSKEKPRTFKLYL